MPNPICLTVGTFDGLHAGHIRMLENAARIAPLHVGVNTDRFTAAYKQPPLFGEHDRAATVAALSCVTDVHMNDTAGRELILRLNPRFLAVGPDWLGRDYLAQINMPDLFHHGITLVFLPPARNERLASSRLRAA